MRFSDIPSVNETVSHIVIAMGGNPYDFRRVQTCSMTIPDVIEEVRRRQGFRRRDQSELRCTDMPIPTSQDYALAEIDDIASGIKTRLTTFRYAGRGERDIGALRDQLQDFVNKVMAFARST
jgi:hypothetical protein